MCKQRVVVEISEHGPQPAATTAASESESNPEGLSGSPTETSALIVDPVGHAFSEATSLAHRAERVRIATARWLAAGFGLISVAGLTPTILGFLEPAGVGLWLSIPLWSYVLIFATTVQLSYAVYLATIPDWTSAWIVTLVSTFLSTAYALFLGLALLAGKRGPLVELLELGDHLGDRRLASWCFIMLSLTGLWSYYAGRFSIKWSRTSRIREE